MKSFTKIALTIITTVIPIFIVYYLNKEEPNLLYSLSQNIPTKFLSESQTESVQLLEVLNKGNKLAEKIRIKITKYVSDYDLSRYSLNDSVLVVNDEELFELYYPELPPEGTFKLIIKSKGKGINESNLSIISSHGKASNIRFSEGKISIWELAFVLFVLSIFVLSNVKNFIDISVSSLESKANYYDKKYILQKSKPFYLSSNKWSKIRQLALDNYFDHKNYYSIKDMNRTEFFKVLNSDMPDFLLKDEWEKLTNDALIKYKENVLQALSQKSYYQDFEAELELTKPKNMGEITWNDIVKSISDSYIDHKKRGIQMSYNKSEINSKLKSTKPIIIKEDNWNEYIKFCQSQYYYYIREDLDFKDKPYEFVKKFELELLSEKQRESITNIVYKLSLTSLANIVTKEGANSFVSMVKPDWIKEKDYESFKHTAQNVIDYHKKKEEYLSVVKSLLKLISTGQKKEFIFSSLDGEERLQIEKIIKDFEEFHLNKKSIEEKLKEVTSLKDKITKQLEIINDCLNDPQSLNRIEDYNNVFSTGNFENLKKIANYHSKIIGEKA